MKAFLIDVENRKAEVVNVKPKLENYYRILNIDTIDITERKIGEFFYDIICDDEALLKQNPIPSAFYEDGNPAICGNLLFCSSDKNGYERGLTEKKIENLKQHLAIIFLKQEPTKPIPVMTGVKKYE